MTPAEAMRDEGAAAAPPRSGAAAALLASGWSAMVEGVRGDVAAFHALRFQGRRPSWWTRARVLLGSHGLWVLVVYRVDRCHLLWRPTGWPGRLLKLVLHGCISVASRTCQVLTKCDVVPSSGALEPGVYLSDLGYVKLGVRSVGAGTVIHTRVTLGRGLGGQDKPEIGRRVWIGPGCVIFGGFEVGDGATLLPGTVLSRSAPPGVVLRGNPAKVVRRGFDNSALRRSLAADEAAVRAALDGS